MTITTTTQGSVTGSTLEPVKRILRTVIAVVIALASAIPYFIGSTHLDTSSIAGVLTQVGAVTTAISAFGASPAGNYIFGLIGLDATAVAKVTATVNKTSSDASQTVVAAVNGVNTVVVDSKAVAAAVKDTETPTA